MKLSKWDLAKVNSKPNSQVGLIYSSNPWSIPEEIADEPEEIVEHLSAGAGFKVRRMFLQSMSSIHDLINAYMMYSENDLKPESSKQKKLLLHLLIQKNIVVIFLKEMELDCS